MPLPRGVDILCGKVIFSRHGRGRTEAATDWPYAAFEGDSLGIRARLLVLAVVPSFAAGLWPEQNVLVIVTIGTLLTVANALTRELLGSDPGVGDVGVRLEQLLAAQSATGGTALLLVGLGDPGKLNLKVWRRVHGAATVALTTPSPGRSPAGF